ncbi:hypothetical protein ACT7DH_25490 [Bacillus pacificus]
MPNIAMCRREDSLYDIAMELIERQIDAMPVVKDTKQGLEVVGTNYKNKYYTCVCKT